jgi:hypothetical protein
VKAFMYGEEALWHRLMEKLTEAMARYLEAQARAGADLLQVFDSWVGALGPADYRRYVKPHMKRLFQALRPLGVPVIHFGVGTMGLLQEMREAGGDVMAWTTTPPSLGPEVLGIRRSRATWTPPSSSPPRRSSGGRWAASWRKTPAEQATSSTWPRHPAQDPP